MKPRCNCKAKLHCKDVSEESRKQIFTDFWNIGNLNVQREYISRMIEVSGTKRKSKGAQDRRKCTKKYFLQVDRNQRLHVCQKCFLIR